MPFKSSEKNREYQRNWKRIFYQKRRLDIIKRLGGKCIKCGNTDERVLQIDHIEPCLKSDPAYGGSNLINAIATGKTDMKKFQLLCANCHMIKSFEDRKKFNNWNGNTKTKKTEKHWKRGRK